MTIFSEIKYDHRVILELFQSVEMTSHRSRKRELRKLGKMIEAHSRSEEDVLYRNLIQHRDARTLVLENYEEHHRVDLLLKDLEEISIEDDLWPLRLEDLRLALVAHIQEEERTLFKRAKKNLHNERTLTEMGHQFRALVNERLDHEVPSIHSHSERPDSITTGADAEETRNLASTGK